MRSVLFQRNTERRIRGDLSEVYKIIHGIDKIDRCKFFALVNEKHKYDTTGHNLRIWTPHTTNMLRKKFFDIRVIKYWNDLPSDVVHSQLLSSFRRKVDKHFKEKRYL